MNRRRKIQWTVISIIMGGLLLLVFWGDNGLLELHRLQGIQQRLSQANADLTQKNIKMYRTIDRLQNDPVFVENMARRELGMVRSDEVIFTFKTNATTP